MYFLKGVKGTQLLNYYVSLKYTFIMIVENMIREFQPQHTWVLIKHPYKVLFVIVIETPLKGCNEHPVFKIVSYTERM